MKKKKTIRNSFVIFVAACVLTGCGSMRFATTLKPDPGMQGLQVAGDVKFSIVQLDAAQNKQSTMGIDIKEIKTPDLRGHAVDVYPRLFGNDFADLPVFLDVDCKCSNSDLGAMLTGFTLGVIPFPIWSDVECKVRSAVPDANGYLIDETEAFVLTNSLWLTLIGPLGLLPVPGRSDLPRDICFFDLSDETYMVRSKQLAMDSLTEAVARSIRRADPAKLKAALESRKARIRQVDINGRTFWSFLGFGRSKSKDQRDVASLVLYREYPSRGAKPVEQVLVARLEDGKWRPVTGYLRSIKELTAASVLLVDGKPSKVVIKKVDKPPLEDFIELPQKSTVGDIRWNNGILVEIKNSTLPRLMREKNPEYLIDLVTRIEKAVLNLNERAQLADNRVQAIVVKGEGNPEMEGEMSVLCRQRIAIFNPILSALKQAVAAKRR